MGKIDFSNSYNKNAIPEILQKIALTLKKFHPSVSDEIILNMLDFKVTEMLTTKHITIDESGNTVIPNTFALILLGSSGGKDRLYKDLNNFVFADFNDWFRLKAQEIYQTQMEKYNEAIKNLNENKKNDVVTVSQGGISDVKPNTNECPF